MYLYMKMGMMKLYQALKENGLTSKIILQVHDEVVIEGPKSEGEQVKALIKESLEGAVSFDCPLSVDANQAANWVDAK